jgi:hypothetical protein
LVDLDAREALRPSCVLEDRSAHSIEDVDIAGQAIGEGKTKYAMADDGDGGDIGGQSDHRSGSIDASVSPIRAALDQRLKNEAAKSGIALMRLRKMVAFDRFLARLVEVAPGRWVLKGALALDLRLAGATRTTKDIDLGRLDDEEAATELAGRLFEAFPVDVAFSDPVRWLPDRLAGTELLAFAGIERVDVPGLAIEQHVAEKLHAYTRADEVDEILGAAAPPLIRPAVASYRRPAPAERLEQPLREARRDRWPAARARTRPS